MIDSHCHLDYLAEPRVAVRGLRACITVGTDVERNDRSLELARELDNVWAAVGIHPNDASLAADPAVRARVEEQARAAGVVAIGETGFDTHWDRETLEAQRAAFDWQATLAATLDLPLILHVRDRQGSDDASRAAAAAIRESAHPKGVLHCFNGNEELLACALDLGWFVSFAGNLTYPSATNLRAIAAQVPEDRLMVETDSPFLAPVPHRGKRNQPGFVRHTLVALAECRSAPPEQLEEATDGNALRFYHLPG